MKDRKTYKKSIREKSVLLNNDKRDAMNKTKMHNSCIFLKYTCLVIMGMVIGMLIQYFFTEYVKTDEMLMLGNRQENDNYDETELWRDLDTQNNLNHGTNLNMEKNKMMQEKSTDFKINNETQNNKNVKIGLDIDSSKMQNFKSSKISQLKPKKIWIPIIGTNGGFRRVPPVEIRSGKNHNTSVKVWLFDEFLSSEECDNLINAHESHLKIMKMETPLICFDSVKTLREHLKDLKKENLSKSITPNDFVTGTMCINKTFSRQLEKWGLKWSYSTSFYLGESKFSRVLSNRIQDATMQNETHGGKFSIISYPLGVGYKAHTDCLVDSIDQRDRYSTFLIYLNDLEGDSGETFNALSIDIKPKKGRALVWNNMNHSTGKCEVGSSHAANPIENIKKKYILKRWYYYKNFYELGKRLAEPNIPQRSSNTPKVSCDEYSCKMFDEWSYDHLLEFRENKNLRIHYD